MKQNDSSGLNIQELLLEIIEYSSKGDYIFRGEPKCYPKISSTLYRQYEEEINTEHFSVEFAQKEMLEDVKKYTAFADETDILTELQHFGGNTNLIDFTTDYLIALFFACDSSFDEDGRVILLSKTSGYYLIELPKKNQNNRVISQKSTFVRSQTGLIDDNHVEIVSIPSKFKREAMGYLKKHHGITTETIYNDLLGYIQNQERHHTAYAESYIGFTYAQKGEYENAISHFDETIRLNPNVISAYKNRGTAKAKLGRHEEAIADYDNSLGLRPRDAEAYYNRGISLFELGRTEAAIDDFSEAISIDPDHFKAYGNRGTAKTKLSQYAEAVSDFDEAIRINSEDATLFFKRGLAREGCRQLEEAIADFDRAIRMDPKYALAYLSRGAIKGALNLFEEAIADFDEALRLDPEDAAALCYRGIAAKSLGQKEEAVENLKQAQALATKQGLSELVQLSQKELGTLSSNETDS